MPDSAPAILVRAIGSDQWTTPETSAYENEAPLQALLATDPGRIPGVPSNAVAVQELPTSAGPVDVCVIAPDGTITVVECKLAKNSEKRRMVGGQVIDYASALRAEGVKAATPSHADHPGSPRRSPRRSGWRSTRRPSPCPPRRPGVR